MREAAPEAGVNLITSFFGRACWYSCLRASCCEGPRRTMPSPTTAALLSLTGGMPSRKISIWDAAFSGLMPNSANCPRSFSVNLFMVNNLSIWEIAVFRRCSRLPFKITNLR